MTTTTYPDDDFEWREEEERDWWPSEVDAPDDGPVRRMRILELRALCGCTVEETARRFLVTEMTLQNGICRRSRRVGRGLEVGRR